MPEALGPMPKKQQQQKMKINLIIKNTNKFGISNSKGC